MGNCASHYLFRTHGSGDTTTSSGMWVQIDYGKTYKENTDLLTQNEPNGLCMT